MDKVGRYVIISELGRGAMGIVYRASDPTIDREVALKVVSLNASAEQGTDSPTQMFMREVRAAGRLSHPSIITIHDAFDDQETRTSCIVMELVPGMTLEKILEAGHKLTVEQTLNLVRQVAEGLDYAHRHLVIHRDLKPANILVTADGLAKITDFGIAKVLAREGAARTVGVMGTPSYMSPEQVRGGDIDARTDIFSLGIILFTMLAGKRPFVGNTAAVMFKIVYEEPPAPSSLNPQLAPAYDYVVKRCLAKDRTNRYSSARELVGDLDDLQNDRPPRSQTAVTPEPAASTDRTLVMTTPGAIKTASPPLAPSAAPPRARPAQPPVAPTRAGSPVAPAPPGRPAAMPVSGPTKVAPQTPAPRPAPPQRPSAPPNPASANPGSPVSPPATMVMPVSELMKAASQQPASRSVPAPPAASNAPVRPQKPNVPPPVPPMPPGLPLTGQTLPMHVPDLSTVSPPAPPPPSAPKPPPIEEPPLMERTLPMRVPDLTFQSSPSPPPATPVPSVPPNSSLIDRTRPTQTPDFSSVPPAAFTQTVEAAAPPPVIVTRPPTAAAVLQPAGSASYLPAVVTQPEEPTLVSAAARPASKSKLIPALLGGLVVVALMAATWGYWKFHQSKAAPQAPAQAAVQAPPPVEPVPATAPNPSPPPTVEQPAPPPNTAPQVTKKAAVHKPKPLAAPHPSTPEPAPPSPQPQPAVVTPAPAPAPPTPSPEAIAKAEAAKLANVPHIVQVSCNFGLKEATFTFSSGGKTLFEETFKGKKKKKEGFLGLKGTYEGSFSHTITVPAGASEVSLRVVAKDGADLNKATSMPSPGGFVPTLTVNVDSEHITFNWKGSSAGF